MNSMNVTAILPAAGQATRMGGEKQRLQLCGMPVLARTWQVFDCTPCVREIVVVARPEDVPVFAEYPQKYGFVKPARVVVGADSRQQSVRCGVLAADPTVPLVAIHDGARPLITVEEITAVVQAAAQYGAAAASTPVKDTIKQSSDGEFVSATPPRSELRAVQTPQVFEAARYRTAMERALAEGLDFTDDCQLFEWMGWPVRLVPTGYQNMKITTPEDMTVAWALMKKEAIAVRVGHGYDVHRLTAGRALVLGGVTVPYEKGLLGHSDADVLVHAIMDAMLGAAALGDIGRHFPDTDAAYAGADSVGLLKCVTALLAEHGWRVGNIDATVLAQAPKLGPYMESMRRNVAAACGVQPDAVNIKATTEEKLGFTGSGEGMAAHAVCLIERSDSV